MRIAIITGTTRSGRVTPRLAEWVKKAAVRREGAQFMLLDLQTYDIPMLEEAPWHNKRQLTAGSKQWLSDLASADGIIIVTAEYNHTIPAVLKNALDYTHGELNRKPVAIVSHGSSSGVRANEHLRQIVNSKIGAFPISATVTYVGNIAQTLTESGEYTGGTNPNDDKLEILLDDIIWYAKAIKQAKEKDETN